MKRTLLIAAVLAGLGAASTVITPPVSLAQNGDVFNNNTRGGPIDPAAASEQACRQMSPPPGYGAGVIMTGPQYSEYARRMAQSGGSSLCYGCGEDTICYRLVGGIEEKHYIPNGTGSTGYPPPTAVDPAAPLHAGAQAGQPPFNPAAFSEAHTWVDGFEVIAKIRNNVRAGTSANVALVRGQGSNSPMTRANIKVQRSKTATSPGSVLFQSVLDSRTGRYTDVNRAIPY